VLLTARVPGILAEVSFISNRQGEAALARPGYRRALGRALARGVLDFIKGEKRR
jgi:N-acetylmuramoyl-L-alanine amidase